jgi:hypothetical protein
MNNTLAPGRFWRAISASAMPCGGPRRKLRTGHHPRNDLIVLISNEKVNPLLGLDRQLNRHSRVASRCSTIIPRAFRGTAR